MSRMMRGKGVGLAVLLFFAVLFLFPQFAAGSTAPEITRLLTFTNPGLPGRVAVDNYGNMIIADMTTFKYCIRVYDSKGTYLRRINLTYMPTAIRVSPDNLLYVAESRTFGINLIEVFKIDGTRVRTKTVDFKVLSIAFLSTGEMYLIDANYFKIKKFDGDMNQVFEFGGFAQVYGNATGNIAGKFVNPSTIVINEQKGELYVLDKGAVVTESGYSNTFVWRVQVFDLSGNFLRSFSNYGYGIDGKVGSAAGMAQDKQGRLYIPDNYQNIIVVYDEFGSYLKTIYDNAQPIYSPIYVTFANDRLYTSSTQGKYVAVFGIDSYASLSVDPLNIELSWQQGMTVPSKDIGISSSGPGLLTWDAKVNTDDSWLSLSQTNGEVAGGSSQNISLILSPGGLDAGTYTGTIDITSNGGSEKVNITLVVTAPPVLSVSPTQFNVSKKTTETVDPLNVDISITNDASGSLMWQATADLNWLAMSPLSGITNTIPVPHININNSVLPGTYVGHITVTADGAIGSPATITINLEVIPTNKVNVTTNNADATFTITGPAGSIYNGSGTAYTIESVEAGSYTVTFNKVAGFKTPASVTQEIISGGEISLSGEYIDLRRQLNVIASHGPGPKESSEFRVFKADCTDCKEVLTLTPPLPNAYGAVGAAGDFDGDGLIEVLTGTGPGPKNDARAAIVRLDNTVVAEFKAFDSKFGIEVAAGDLDGDGRDEIVVGEAKTSSSIRIFRLDGAEIVDAGLSIEPYEGANGVALAVADIDGDGKSEIIASSANGGLWTDSHVPVARIYKVEDTDGVLSVKNTKSFQACTESVGTNIAAGDIDSDGIAEIMVVCPYETGSMIRIYKGDGALVREFGSPFSGRSYIAAGDTNMDGIAEIILGEAPSNHKTTVKILDTNGLVMNSFDAFTDSFGVRVSAGNLGY